MACSGPMANGGSAGDAHGAAEDPGKRGSRRGPSTARAAKDGQRSCVMASVGRVIFSFVR